MSSMRSVFCTDKIPSITDHRVRGALGRPAKAWRYGAAISGAQPNRARNAMVLGHFQGHWDWDAHASMPKAQAS